MWFQVHTHEYSTHTYHYHHNFLLNSTLYLQSVKTVVKGIEATETGIDNSMSYYTGRANISKLTNACWTYTESCLYVYTFCIRWARRQTWIYARDGVNGGVKWICNVKVKWIQWNSDIVSPSLFHSFFLFHIYPYNERYAGVDYIWVWNLSFWLENTVLNSKCNNVFQQQFGFELKEFGSKVHQCNVHHGCIYEEWIILFHENMSKSRPGTIVDGFNSQCWNVTSLI